MRVRVRARVRVRVRVRVRGGVRVWVGAAGSSTTEGEDKKTDVPQATVMARTMEMRAAFPNGGGVIERGLRRHLKAQGPARPRDHCVAPSSPTKIVGDGPIGNLSSARVLPFSTLLPCHGC